MEREKWRSAGLFPMTAAAMSLSYCGIGAPVENILLYSKAGAVQGARCDDVGRDVVR